MVAEPLGYWMAWLWNIVVALGLLSLPLGYNQGLEAGEFPFLIDVLLLAVFALMTWQVTVTVAQRVEPSSTSASGICWRPCGGRPST